jgi:hypothetical protein
MRFTHYRAEEHGVWHIFDTKYQRIVCTCRGWYAPHNAATICDALEAHEDKLYNLFGGKTRLNIGEK